MLNATYARQLFIHLRFHERRGRCSACMSSRHKKLQNVIQLSIRKRVKYNRARGSRVTATVKVSATQGLTATVRSELYSQE